MRSKTIGAAQFKAECLRIIEVMVRDGEPVTITKRGKPVATLTPIRDVGAKQSLFGAMRGSVLRFDDPFSPAVAAEEWESER